MFTIDQKRAINYHTSANAKATADLLTATEEDPCVRFFDVLGVCGEWLVAGYDDVGLIGYVRA